MVSSREIFSYIFIVVVPIFELSCYELLRKTKSHIAIKKRNLTMIKLCTLGVWLAYINLINSLFGVMWCGLHDFFTLLLTPLSVGPQLLRGIKLCAMLKYNKLMTEFGNGSQMHHYDITFLKEGECSSKIEEECSQREGNDLVKKINSKQKLKKYKREMTILLRGIRWLLILFPLSLGTSMFFTTDLSQLVATEFDQCVVEQQLSMNIGRVSGAVFVLISFFTTAVVRRCDDELGIRQEINRNIIILFITNVLIFMIGFMDYRKWQPILYASQQLLLSFSMIILPCYHGDYPIIALLEKTSGDVPSVDCHSENTSERVSKFSRRISVFSHRSLNQPENKNRRKELTLSLDTGLGILLSNAEGVSAFTEHCAREFSVENIQFWCAVNEYHKVIDLELAQRSKVGLDLQEENKFRLFAKHINDTYIKNGADLQINISATLSQAIQEQLYSSEIKLDRNIFDKAQQEIYSLMSRDSYPRFLASKYNSKLPTQVLRQRNSLLRMRRGSLAPK